MLTKLSRLSRYLSSLKNAMGFVTWPVVVLVVCYTYLGFHILGSRMGVWQYHDYQSRIAKTRIQLKNLKAEHLKLEKKAGQLRSQSLDLDALDEHARRILNVSDTNDIVIWLDEPG